MLSQQNIEQYLSSVWACLLTNELCAKPCSRDLRIKKWKQQCLGKKMKPRWGIPSRSSLGRGGGRSDLAVSPFTFWSWHQFSLPFFLTVVDLKRDMHCAHLLKLGRNWACFPVGRNRVLTHFFLNKWKNDDFWMWGWCNVWVWLCLLNTGSVFVTFLLPVLCYSYPAIYYFVSSFPEEVSLESIYLPISKLFFAALPINLFCPSKQQVEHAAWQM